MCGIAGQVCLTPASQPQPEIVQRILAGLSHRGPDHSGMLIGDRVVLANARLSIIDLAGGNQPLATPEQRHWIVLNGEIFNYLELREILQHKGVQFATQSDTEVLLQQMLTFGVEGLTALNGQFAAAILDAQTSHLTLFRDRFGERPLFYTVQNGSLFFASEVAALLTVPGVSRSLDPARLAEIFTYWAPPPGKTAYSGIFELLPGERMVVDQGGIAREIWFQPRFTQPEQTASPGELVEQFTEKLTNAVKIRLRADVPVGCYLSGGLDSSVTTALARKFIPSTLHTFSIGFEHGQFDETPHQTPVAAFLGTQHHAFQFSSRELGEAFPSVVRATSTPILRTAPVPMYLLARHVHQQGMKVVLTGEGADEVLGGYDLFKEMKIRRFWAADPQSTLRPNLVTTLYPQLNADARRAAFFIDFFKKGLFPLEDPYYSHRLRWQNTGRNRRFLAHPGEPADPADLFPSPQGFIAWTALQQAQYWEIVTFMSPYLLSSQGDRMAMAHSVEGRYPFLDSDLTAFAFSLPDWAKLPGLGEKWILRQTAQALLPRQAWARRKQPYRAPIHDAFFTPQPLDYVRELFSPDSLHQGGLFDPAPCQALFGKASQQTTLSETEEMALVGILSAQILQIMDSSPHIGLDMTPNTIVDIRSH